MSSLYHLSSRVLAIPILILASVSQVEAAGILENLKAFGGRLEAGDPAVSSSWEGGTEGPKGIAAGDLDKDDRQDLAISNLDGTVSVYRNEGGGVFTGPTHLHTPALLRGESSTLREIIIANLTPGDDWPDIATCDLENGVVVVFPNPGNPAGEEDAFEIQAWPFARNLTAGDFNGDGLQELAVAGPGAGLQLYRIYQDGEGNYVPAEGAGLAEISKEIGPLFNTEGGSSKPVYSLMAHRFPGRPRDELVLTNARADGILILSVGPAGSFSQWSFVGNVRDPYDLDVGPLTAPAGSGQADLVTAHRNSGTVEIRRGTSAPGYFHQEAIQTIQIPGGPRAVKIIDINGDDWNDLVVVVRNLDLVLTYRNEGGRLVPDSEMPVGVSPRDLAVADLDGDGRINDAAVINRISQDVSILTAYQGRAGFSALDHTFLVEGEVAELVTADLNLDGRDDVIQLLRASGEVSVRLAVTGGSGVLGFPSLYAVGILPGGLRIADMNGDGFPDLVTANLGREGFEPGSVSVLLNDGPGGIQGPGHFSRIKRAFVPEGGRLFSLEVADFDRNGGNKDDPGYRANLDVAAAFLDYRVGFFRGVGDGSLEFQGATPFVEQARGIAVGDFDGDHDIDLAGAGWSGESGKARLVVLENDADFFQDSPRRTEYTTSIQDFDAFGTNDLKARDINGDGDLDLVATSREGILVYLGSVGMTFQEPTSQIEGVSLHQATSSVFCDFDGDGDEDLAVSGRIFSTVTVLLAENGGFTAALTFEVPAGQFLATGDLDGDGKCDLLGSGEMLWTALSGSSPVAKPPLTRQGIRQGIEGLVFNEMMAMNTAFRVGDEGQKWDWIELYYSGPQEELLLDGYALKRISRDLQEERISPLDGLAIEKEQHLLLFCTKDNNAYHTGFKLPVDGAILVLQDPGGNELDRVEYPAQRNNIAFGRYADSHWMWMFNQVPSPGAPNVYNGTLSPTIRLEAVVPAYVEFDDVFQAYSALDRKNGVGVRFLATARDDVGVVSVRLKYGYIDAAKDKWIALYDDGLHGDGKLLDGIFSNTLDNPLELFPPGGGSCVSAEVVDPDGNEEEVPQVGGDPGGEREGYCLAVVEPQEMPPPLRISEIVSSLLDKNIFQDEFGGTPDYVEIHNISDEEYPLQDIVLGERFPAYESWFTFARGAVIEAGEYIVIRCDRNLDQGPLHAPFELSSENGGQLMLAFNSRIGGGIVRKEFDRVRYPPLPSNVAYTRLTGQDWKNAVPTPGSRNPRMALELGDVDGNGELNLTDCIRILEYLFLSGYLDCPAAANLNGDSQVDLADAIYLLANLFLAGGQPMGRLVNCE